MAEPPDREERIEEVLDLPDGPHTFVTSKAPFRNVDGATAGLVGVTRDITEWTRLMAQQQRLHDLEHRLATTVQEAVLGRSERDTQETGDQVVTAEDSVCRITSSKGNMDPVAEGLISDVSVITRLARRTLPDSKTDWDGFERDYDRIRESIGRVIPGFEDFNRKLVDEGSFVLPHPVRDARIFPTVTGKARFASEEVPVLEVPPGRLILNTVRAHDQHNTAILGLNDRYRGIRRGRFVIFVSPEDLDQFGIADGQTVDVFSERPGEGDRVLRGYRAVAYPTKRGCAAMYFPEANELVHRSAVDAKSNCPAYKDVVIRIEPGLRAVAGGRPSAI